MKTRHRLNGMTALVAVLLIILGFTAFLLRVAQAQTPAKPPQTKDYLSAAPAPTFSSSFVPSADHHKDLEIAQLRALLAQQQLQRAQDSYNASIQALLDEGEKVRVEEGWPKDVQFDTGTLTFHEAASPAAQKEKGK